MNSNEAFKEMISTIQKDVNKLDALVTGKYETNEAQISDHLSLDEKINQFNAFLHKQISKTFVNKLETKICQYKIVHTKMAKKLNET